MKIVFVSTGNTSPEHALQPLVLLVTELVIENPALIEIVNIKLPALKSRLTARPYIRRLVLGTPAIYPSNLGQIIVHVPLPNTALRPRLSRVQSSHVPPPAQTARALPLVKRHARPASFLAQLFMSRKMDVSDALQLPNRLLDRTVWT